MANVEIMATFCFYFILHGHFFFSFLIIFFVLPLYFLHVPACCYFVEPHWSFFLVFHLFSLFEPGMACCNN